MKIKTLIKKRKAFYKGIKRVNCPIFKEKVYFTSNGWHHLLYKQRRPRNINEQYLKLSCLVFAPEVIKKCRLISKIRKVEKKVKGKIKQTTQYELIHKIPNEGEIRVIIEKIGTGKYQFLSIMPHKKRHKTKKRR